MDYTILYNQIFQWDGFGGLLKLASGRCFLRLVELHQTDTTVIKPYVAITEDLPADAAQDLPPDAPQKKNHLSMRSCCAHIATRVTQKFKINPKRMRWLEYYPESIYGFHQEKRIPEQYEEVTFTWEDEKAFHPSFRVLKPPVLDQVKWIHQELQKTTF